jgi:phosphoglycerate dehydrogenase-like enzyme
MTAHVLCLRPEEDFSRVGALPPDTLQVSYRRPEDADVPVLVKEARALVLPAVGPKLSPALLEGAPLEIVQVTCAGVDRLDRSAMRRLGIPVANVPGGSNAAVAEYVVTAAAALLRRFSWADAEIRSGNYGAFRARMLADNLGGLEDALVGIVGLGVIGTAVAAAFRAMGARVCYYDPAPGRPDSAGRVDLGTLLREADVVSLHVPLLPATRNLIGEAELACMKPGAVLIQASRGGVVDEAALARRLQAGALGGAAVDVYTTEPPQPDNPLLALESEAAKRILFTPHIAGVTRQSSARLFRLTWDNVERVLVRKEPPLNRVY